MEKLLIIGTGLLGSKCANNSDFKTFGTFNRNPIKIKNCDLLKLDITDRVNTYELIKKLNPNYIVHTAALTNVDYCENNKDEAFKVNAKGTKNVAEAAKDIGAKFIYISTDYVFDGEKGMYKEEDPTNPINQYGRSKLDGESMTINTLDNYLIARTSVLYGENPKTNFVTWVLQELKKGNEIRIVEDQFNTPTLADNLAEVILELIKNDAVGVFHVSGIERVNRFDFVKKIAEIYDLNGKLIIPITSNELNWIAERPKDSSLDVTKISKLVKPLNVEESLKRMVAG
jgi:dTDP-4-dehydrorhamnose reductase